MMSRVIRGCPTIIAIVFGLSLHGQSLDLSGAAVPAHSTDSKSATVPAGAASVMVPVTVTPLTSGKDVISVALTHPQVQVTLITPAAIEVTAQNAASLGYEYARFDQSDSPSLPPLVTSSGAHTVFVLPAGAAAGVYQVKANATGVPADSGMTVSYSSRSPIRAAATTEAPWYLTGAAVTLSGILFDDQAPVTGATVTAQLTLETNVSSQITIGNYQLVSQVPAGANAVDRTYSARAANSGPARTLVEAEASVGGGAVIDHNLVFRDVPAGGTADSQDTFTIRVFNGESFDPAAIEWRSVARSAAGSVTLADSGARDAAPGDGPPVSRLWPGISSPRPHPARNPARACPGRSPNCP